MVTVMQMGRLEIEAGEFEGYLYKNITGHPWPFYLFMRENMACSCGSLKFYVLRLIVAVPDRDNPTAEPSYRTDYRVSCSVDGSYKRDAWIVGYMDFSDMSFCVYDVPEAPPMRAVRWPVDSLQNAMNAAIPYGTEYFDIEAFDDSLWKPESAEVPSIDEPVRKPAPRVRGRKGRILPSGPELTGF
jgi:hypothetical protein